ncbi:TRIC cation channel family protein [Falsiroseomonas selenitidurans]|uniref:Transporter substrate-binding domain-containing protein n=1 Tax=Falsiroseomonas selenitidurans TaxID=2716335 RepID=A0ABX1E0G1_9PROT|nr:transporter substrate-binding domain-containing protein [Falsiroseomonas selenitidurans]NKC30647.1 transporter substrate-binding domain-containing protein [Falsiroseomonas selenitidurans]
MLRPDALRRVLALVLALLAWPAFADQAALRAGWYATEPQQYLRQGELTGLDIEMVRAIAAHAGQPVSFTPMGYLPLLEAVAEGRMALATGIARTEQRAARYALSLPYRQDTNVLIMRRGEAAALRFRDATGLAAYLGSGQRFRLGVRRGYSYFHPALDAWIGDPGNAGLVRAAEDDPTNIRRLLAGEIDGFLAERLSVALAITALGAGPAVEEQAMRLMVPLHLAFSRAGTPAETLAAFNAAILALQADGTLESIGARFRFPLLLSQTIDSDWFRALRVVGAVASALAGALAARQSQWSLFGAFVLAGVTAASGGVMRDLLVGRFPIGIARDPLFLMLIFGTVAGFWMVTHLWSLLRGRAMLAFWVAQLAVGMRRRRIDRWLFDAADALGLGASTVLGVAVAFGMRAEPFWLWGPMLGTITGAGGGILRDVLRGGGNIPNLKTGFYGEVALIWSLALSAWLSLRGAEIEIDEVVVVVVAAVLGAVVTRLAAVAFAWRPPRLG